MAESYKGLTIKFGADYTELSKALTDIGKQTSAAQRELKAVQSALKLNPGNTQLLAKQQEALGQKVSATKSKLDAYNQALEILKKREQENGGLTESEQKQYDQLSRSIMTTEANLKQYTSQLGKARIEYAANDSVMGKVGSKVTELGDKYGSAGEKVAKVSGKASTALVGTATATYGAFEQVEKGQNVALKASGAIGEAANGIKQAVKDVASHAPGDFETVGTAVGGVSAHFKVTGGDLDDLSTKFLKFAKVTGTDVASDIESVSMSMKAFNVPASDTGNVLDLIASTAATTGLSVDTLTSAVNQNGSTFREMGLSLQDSVTLMGNFEAAGIPADQMLTGLKKAAANCAKSGQNMGDVLKQLVTDLQDPAKQADATKQAFDLFGSKAATSFVDAAESGRINLGALGGSIDSASGYVDKMKSETTTAGDKMAGAFKQITLAGADFGEGFAPIVEKAAGVIQGLATQVKELPEPEKEAAVNAVTMAAGITGVVAVGGKAVGGLSDMGKSITNAAKFFAKLGGAADDASGKLSVSNVAMGVAKGGAIALATAGIGFLIAIAADAVKKHQELTDATTGLEGAQRRAISSSKDQAGAVHDTAKSVLEVRAEVDKVSRAVDDAVSKQAQMAKSIEETFQKAYTSNGQLDAYTTTIDQLANQSGLSVKQQADLKLAVDELNKACGTSYSVIDAENGKIADQTGKVQENTGAIHDLVAAKKLSNEMDAASSAYQDAYKQQTVNSKNLTDAKKAEADAEQKLNEKKATTASWDLVGQAAIADLSIKVQQSKDKLKEQQDAYDSNAKAMDSYSDQMSLLKQAQDGGTKSIAAMMAGNQEFIASIEASGHSASSLASQMVALGVSSEQAQKILADPTSAKQLADNYDGTSTSLIDSLGKMVDGFDTTAAAAAAKTADISDAISKMTDADKSALSALGISTEDLANKLSDAGISSTDFAKLGGESFSKLYNSAHGDMSKVKQDLDILNHAKVDPKTVTISDDGTITAATGAIIGLDSITIKDKSYTVSDNGSIVTASGAVTGFDAQTLATKNYTVTDDGTIEFENGNVLDLDRMTINGKHYSVSNDGTINVENDSVYGLNANNIDNKNYYVSNNGTANTATDETNRVTDAVNNIPKNPEVTVSADTSTAWDQLVGIWNYLTGLVSHAWTIGVSASVDPNDHAAGGIRLNAAGGVRYHAGGAIATRAMPLDIVGEAGAEAIVPLTNKKYVTPFARAVAEQIAVVTAQGVPGVVQSPPAAPVVNISQKTQVVAADEDVYVAVTIANRALVSAANQYL